MMQAVVRSGCREHLAVGAWFDPLSESEIEPPPIDARPFSLRDFSTVRTSLAVRQQIGKEKSNSDGCGLFPNLTAF
jgi:hypothetical protein